MVSFPSSFPPKHFADHFSVSAKSVARWTRWSRIARGQRPAFLWTLTYGGSGFAAAWICHHHSALTLTVAAGGLLIWGANRLPWPQGSGHDRLWMTGLAAGLVSLGTYGGMVLWQSLDSPALALALIAQGGVTVGLAGLVVYLLWQQQRRSSLAPTEDPLMDLGHPLAIRRLRALRYLEWALRQEEPRNTLGDEWRDYLYVLVSQESDPVVRRYGLRLLGQLTQGVSPLASPINLPQPLRMGGDRAAIAEEITESV